MKSKSRQSGFTLIEIMVAVAILTVISLLLWQSSAVLMTAKDRYETEDIRFHEVLLTLSRIADDLSMAFLYQSPDHLGATGSGEMQREIRFYGKDDGDEDSIQFASMSNVRYMKDSPENEQAEIGYFLKKVETDEGMRMDLIKRTQSPPDLETEEGGKEYVLLEDVLELRLQYYDSGRKEWRPDWDSASVEYNKLLPRAVEIALTIKDPVVPEESRTFVTTALLEMAPGPNDF